MNLVCARHRSYPVIILILEKYCNGAALLVILG